MTGTVYCYGRIRRKAKAAWGYYGQRIVALVVRCWLSIVFCGLDMLTAFLLFDRSITPRKRPSVFFGRVFFGLVSAGLLAGCSSSFPNAFEAQLANHLTDTGAKMYGAYWCPHCATQKEYFGGAAAKIPYVECDPEGVDNQAELCSELEITAYPTWIIEGEYYTGTQPLRALAEASGFEEAIADENQIENKGSS